MLVSTCRKQSSAYREQLRIQTTIQAGAPRQYVIVDKTFRADESIPEVGITDAVVKLWRAASRDTVVLDTCTLKGGYGSAVQLYATPPGCQILPESTYHIRVAWRDSCEGRNFLGELTTAVPGAFSITEPTPGETLLLGPFLDIAWHRSRGVNCYVHSFHYVHGDTVKEYSSWWTRDTFQQFNSPSWLSTPAGAHFVLLVSAHQQDYGGNDDSIGADVRATYDAQTVDSVKFFVRERPGSSP